MSDLGFHQSTGSSNLGLTFIRPLPQGRSAPTVHEGEGSSARGLALTFSDRLFPPRALEESGRAPPVTGLELGHFVLEERIGRGGMGAVFRAVDKRLGRVVAVKVLTVEHSSDHEAVMRFQNEARAAARLDHENIARVHYIGEEHGLHFIAFEFVMGNNVRNLILQRGLLTPAEAVNFTLQIAEALRHTSAANVVHRDIKPSNIIISPSGRAKLVDLGLARHSNPDMSRELTTVGTALGTFDYIAPEQALDARNVDVRSDIYSLGCTLYHMLTGAPPYPTGTMFEKVMNHHRPTPPNPAEKNRQISPLLARVVQKMMAATPDDRYATPDALIDDLIVIADAMGLQPTTPDAKIWQVPLQQRRYSRWNGFRTWSTVALILVVVVLADRLHSLAPQTLLPVPRHEFAPAPAADNLQPQDVQAEAITTPGLQLGPDTQLGVPVPTDNEVPGLTANTTPSISVPSMNRIFAPQDSQVPTILDPLVAADPISADPLSFGVPPGASSPRPIDAGMPPRTEVPAQSTGSAGNLPPTGPAWDSLSSRTSPGQESPRPADAIAVPMYVAVKPALQNDVTSEERFPLPTLAAACAMAKDGWTVEIPVHAPMLVQLETLHITDKKIRLRPAREYRPGIDARPLLRVDLSSQRTLGSFSHAAQVFHIEHGTVEIWDLDVEMLVDPAATVDWSIATLLNGSRLVAQGVSFTMINPGNSRAALVDVPALEISEIGELMPDRMQSRQNQIEFKDCICRGQFDFIVQENSPLSVNLQNTALALSGCMLRIDGSETFIMGMESGESRMTNVVLDHVTVVAARGLLNANSGDHGSLPEIQIELNDSVCTVIGDEQLRQPLLEISGHEDYEVLLDQVSFRNNRDTSFVQVSGPFSLIDSTKSQLPGFGRELTAEEMGVRNFRVGETSLIQLPPLLKLAQWHRIQRTDLELRPGNDNPAIDTSGNLHHAGVDWLASRLPTVLPRGEMDEHP